MDLASKRDVSNPRKPITGWQLSSGYMGTPTFKTGMYFTAQTIKFMVNPVFKHNC